MCRLKDYQKLAPPRPVVCRQLILGVASLFDATCIVLLPRLRDPLECRCDGSNVSVLLPFRRGHLTPPWPLAAKCSPHARPLETDMMHATKLVLVLACAAVWCGNDVWSSSSTGVALAARREAEVEVGS